MQKLFSQEIRFKDENGNDFPDWVEDRLDSFVVKASDPVKVDPDATYKEIGVRSHAKGVFHKKPIKGHELGNKRVFRVHPKAFIVNIVFAWEHAVALTSEAETGFIASHRFPMFVPKEERIDLRYFTIFFKSKRGKHLLGLASPGGAGRNKTLGQSNFAELKLTLPCLEEQVRIADLYESLDNKAKLITQQIDHTQTFKKGLFQQMFV
jgi:type I restriction enzyme S subunit